MTERNHCVRFSEPEMRRIRAKARQRQRIKRDMGVQTRKKDEEASDTAIHVRGLLGEVAAAALLGVEVDPSVSASGDAGYDLTVAGATADVKTRSGSERDFAMYGPDCDLTADLGILCWRTDEAAVKVHGWITRSLWAVESEILDFGGAKRKGITWDRMLPISDLPEALALNE